MQGQCDDGRVAEERDERERTGDGRPYRCLRHAGQSERDRGRQSDEQRNHQHAVDRSAHRPRTQADVVLDPSAEALAQHAPAALRQHFTVLIEVEQQQAREDDDDRVVDRELTE